MKHVSRSGPVRRELDQLGKTIMEVEAGRPVFYRVPECDGCGREERLRMGNSKHLPPEPMKQMLRNRGWQATNKLTCPECQAKRRARPEPQPELKECTVAEAAPPPPLPPEQRRRIREALYDHYLEEKGCYKQAFSDKSLAAKLDVPWAWVKEIREALGFGPDVNEARAEEQAEIAAVKAEMAQLSDEFLSRFGGLEGRLKKLEIGRAYATA